MSNSAALPVRPVLADLVPSVPTARVRDAVLVLAGAGLTGLAAQVAIHTPLSPVPFTLQTLAVLVVGASLGTVRGLLSMAVYLLVGMAGVPWFAGHGSGVGGPAFGYLLGFVVAAGVAGAFARRGADRHVLGTVALFVAGNVIVYVAGVAWLAADLHLGLGQALALGVRPFLVTDAIKIAIAALAFPAVWKLVRR